MRRLRQHSRDASMSVADLIGHCDEGLAHGCDHFAHRRSPHFAMRARMFVAARPRIAERATFIASMFHLRHSIHARRRRTSRVQRANRITTPRDETYRRQCHRDAPQVLPAVPLRHPARSAGAAPRILGLDRASTSPASASTAARNERRPPRKPSQKHLPLPGESFSLDINFRTHVQGGME
jgi:hypothetical protein